MNSSVVKVDVKTPKRRRKSHLLESGKIKFSKLQEQVEEVFLEKGRPSKKEKKKKGCSSSRREISFLFSRRES